jgi:uncharacterized 2Fe-2S/4Fe-4S cluster protein (DUF4445 family)
MVRVPPPRRLGPTARTSASVTDTFPVLVKRTCEKLLAAVVRTMNQVIAQLYSEAGVAADRTYEAVVVGNVTMLHLLFGIDPSPLAVMPFTPAFMEPLLVAASEVGLDIHPNGYIQTLPALGAYVGADIVAGVLATSVVREDKLRVFVDVAPTADRPRQREGAGDCCACRPRLRR